ncbi:protein dispatched [Copidosoma floridanum]|uniref:protein dispatched n=1 Tax=Copidosoma floridanum TaxID=29053 RepID=UPI0006C943F5|nr:protein dispatched [Copidosoma floridanum]
MVISWYSRVLAHYPCIVLIIVFVFSMTCLIVPLTTKKFPDFSDPQLGFEARGTPLAQRLTAWKNLIESSSPRGHLVDNPLEYYYYLQDVHQQRENLANEVNETLPGRNKHKKHKKKHRKYKHKNKNAVNKHRIDKKRVRNESSDLRIKSHRTRDDGDEDDDYNEYRRSVKRYSNYADGFFCNDPSSAYARVVVTSKSKKKTNLWSLEGVRAQCHIDSALRANPLFPSICQRQLQYQHKCCRSWSPANYIALLSNRTSCSMVTKEDLASVESILKECFYFYQKLELTPDCSEDLKCQRKVPELCYANNNNAVYHLLHYLVDVDFLANNGNSTESPLSSVMIILPTAASSSSFDYYKDINLDELTFDDYYVPAVQFGLKSTLFDRQLVMDCVLLLFGFSIVTVCIWFYTGSLLITMTTIIAIIFSLGISYAIYTLVLDINYFPFMNLLTIVVALGIGSDDTFIFCKIWECNKRQKSLTVNNNLNRLVHETIKHAIPSIFVTTLTTTIAFLASIISNVTAINCFSLFSGITVIANFFLMVTWLPASVIVAERFGANFMSSENFVAQKIIRPLWSLVDKAEHLFTNCLIKTVLSLKWFWFSFLLSVAIGSCLIVFHYPGLRLPDTPDFQLFTSSHPFEQYDLFYVKRFHFEKTEHGDGSEVLPLRFVWGVLPIDNGNYLNPESKGTLVMDESFNVSDRNSQVWLENFCKDLRTQPFYRSTLGPLLPNCFIESLQPWMERPCEDPVDSNVNYLPCCRNSTFPYEPQILELCAAEAVAEIHRTPSHLWNFKASRSSPTVGLKFRKQNTTGLNETLDGNDTLTTMITKAVPEIKAVIVEYDSNFTFSLSYAEMNGFYEEVETWFQEQLSKAPAGMKNGWFVSYLEFYELQRALHQGTIWAIIVSVALTLFVLALVTLNLLVSLYAILAVGAAIIVTVATLILMGWKLNILESIAVSTAIGLAVDFSLHYGVSYRSSTGDNRIDRIKATLEQMAGPTIMAALTTGAAGAFMLPSQVLAYIQIGLFLIIIMVISWIYATFFLGSILAIAGPSSRFAQFHYSNFRRTVFKSNRRKVADPDEVESHRSIRMVEKPSSRSEEP